VTAAVGPLTTAIATYPHTRALKDGRVRVPGVELAHVEVGPIVGAFRRMCRGLEFDVCEMAVTTYLTARAYGKPFTALPVFVMRQFHHAPIVVNVRSGVTTPKDLEGKRVGVRAYTVTTGVWARGILAREYGVDLGRITWVVNDEEHVKEYRARYPSNVEDRPGANLAEMVAKGELAAAIGVGAVDAPDVRPLIPNAAEAEAAWYRKTGIYPVNHTVVVKDALLRADPDLAPRLYAAFREAKAAFLRELESGAELPADAQALARRRRVVGDDPVPYGLARNRAAMEAIIQFAVDQQILPAPVAPETVFAANTLGLD
jgi:4,5-dihydroxyphthalate decarboxylase